MATYIEREAVIKDLRGRCIAKYPMSFSMGLFAAADEVSKMKAADVAPVVHSRWVHDERLLAVCLECGMTAVEDGTDYCPNCGARMDGE